MATAPQQTPQEVANLELMTAFYGYHRSRMRMPVRPLISVRYHSSMYHGPRRAELPLLHFVDMAGDNSLVPFDEFVTWRRRSIPAAPDEFDLSASPVGRSLVSVTIDEDQRRQRVYDERNESRQLFFMDTLNASANSDGVMLARVLMRELSMNPIPRLYVVAIDHDIRTRSHILCFAYGAERLALQVLTDRLIYDATDTRAVLGELVDDVIERVEIALRGRGIPLVPRNPTVARRSPVPPMMATPLSSAAKAAIAAPKIERTGRLWRMQSAQPKNTATAPQATPRRTLFAKAK